MHATNEQRQITILVKLVGHTVDDAKVPLKPAAVPTIHVEEEARYAQPCLNNQSSFYAEAGMPTPYYEMGTAVEVNMTSCYRYLSEPCNAGYGLSGSCM